jgi:cytoskeletal protein CcmA (bactofilin family)
MFSRSQTNEPKLAAADVKSFESYKNINAAPEGRTSPPPPPSSPAQPGVASFSARSIIGNDLMIVGQGLRIITKGTLQVDGRVEGDVVGSEVIIGEKGHVTGVVSGENVIVRGEVHGTIKGLRVSLQSSARVEGDVHHNQLSVEQGAHLDGRVRRPQDISELKPDLDIPASPATAA